MREVKGDDGSKCVAIENVICLHITPAGGHLLMYGDKKEWFPEWAIEDCPPKGMSGEAIINYEVAVEKEFI